MTSLIRSCLPGPPVRPVVERRGSTRYPARRAEAMLGWGEGPSLAIEPARVVDISRSGALIVAAAVPPADAAIRLRFEARRVAWIEAAVVRINRTPDGPHWVRAAFLEPCPDDILESVAGASAAGPAVPVANPIGPALARLGLAWPASQAEVQAAYHARAGGILPETPEALDLRRDLETLLMACHREGDSMIRPAPGPGARPTTPA